MLCKHYDTSKGCVYKDKCQFAHGAHELKSSMNVSIFNPDDGSNDDEPNVNDGPNVDEPNVNDG